MERHREEEKVLIQNIKKGSTTAFENFLFLYEKKVFNYIYRLLYNREDAEDLTQETFIKVWKNIASVDTERNLIAWIYKIATNTVWDFLRHKKKLKELYIIDDPENPFETIDPEHTYLNIENTRDLETALEQIKPTYKAVLLLFYREDNDYKTIADILALPINTVKTYLYRAKEALKTELEKMHG